MENGKANPPQFPSPPYLPPLATLMEQMICPRESLAEMKPRIRTWYKARDSKENQAREDVAKVKLQRQETKKKKRRKEKENGKPNEATREKNTFCKNFILQMTCK